MHDRFDDCEHCQSAGSVERGRCQICLAEVGSPASVIVLDERRNAPADLSLAEAVDA